MSLWQHYCGGYLTDLGIIPMVCNMRFKVFLDETVGSLSVTAFARHWNGDYRLSNKILVDAYIAFFTNRPIYLPAKTNTLDSWRAAKLTIHVSKCVIHSFSTVSHRYETCVLFCRSCTDIICLLLFVICIAAFLLIGLWGKFCQSINKHYHCHVMCSAFLYLKPLCFLILNNLLCCTQDWLDIYHRYIPLIYIQYIHVSDIFMPKYGIYIYIQKIST